MLKSLLLCRLSDFLVVLFLLDLFLKEHPLHFPPPPFLIACAQIFKIKSFKYLKVRSARSLESTIIFLKVIFRMTKYKIKIFSLFFRVSVPTRHIAAMEVLNYNFLTIFSPVKMCIVIIHRFALHWVNFTTYWQKQASCQSKLLCIFTDLSEATLTRLVFEDLVLSSIKNNPLRTRNYLLSYLLM